MKKEQIISAVIVAFGIVIGALVLTNPIKTETVTKSDAIKDSFVSGCVKNGSPLSMCSCAYDKLEAKYGTEKIMQAGLEYNSTGNIPNDFVATILDCLK